MKILKKIAILATALLSLVLISCKTDSSETSGSSEPNPTLPGTKGGKDNEKDIFKGLTFYDSSKKEQAEYGYTKYTFSENGTVAITYTKKDDEKEKTYEEAIINYSLSEDGKTVYMTYNKICNQLGSTGSLFTYKELEQYLYNDYAKEALAYLNNYISYINSKESLSEEEKAKNEKDMKENAAKEVGLESYTTDEELLAAMQKYSTEHAEEMLSPLHKMFNTVFQYDLSTGEEDRHPVLTEKNTWGKDLSKFISLQGGSRFYGSDNRNWYLSINYSAGTLAGSYEEDNEEHNTEKRYFIKKVDSSKIYFESSEDKDGNTTKLEAPYTISDDGNTLTVTIGGKTIEAKLTLDQIDLYK